MFSYETADGTGDRQKIMLCLVHTPESTKMNKDLNMAEE